MNYFHEAQYQLPYNISFMFQLFWGFTVFAISIFSLNTFVDLASRSEEILTQAADHDQLTGLPNRYYMTDYLNEQGDKTGLEGYWLAILDIDDFKAINDTLGHNCGDSILKEVAMVLLDHGSDTTVCRWGGEEFLIVGKESGTGAGQGAGSACTGGVETMKLLCKRIRDRHFLYNNKVLHITVTIGMASYHAGMNMREWIESADNRLYEGKRSGKNKVVA